MNSFKNYHELYSKEYTLVTQANFVFGEFTYAIAWWRHGMQWPSILLVLCERNLQVNTGLFLQWERADIDPGIWCFVIFVLLAQTSCWTSSPVTSDSKYHDNQNNMAMWELHYSNQRLMRRLELYLPPYTRISWNCSNGRYCWCLPSYQKYRRNN